jgi:thiamine biosynthesis lipoprotein
MKNVTKINKRFSKVNVLKYFYFCFMMKKISILLLAVITFGSCNQKKFVKITGFAQGTTYSISYYDKAGKDYQPEIDSILKGFDRSVSIYDSTSLISQVNRTDKPLKADKYFTDIFNRSTIVSEQTNGAFDITVGPLVNAFGFGSKKKEKIDKSLIDSLKKLVNYKNVTIENGYIKKKYSKMCIDFNAIAQGYSVDMVSKFLESEGVDDYIVEIGGEVYAKGKKENGKQWNVGIEKPDENNMDHELKATLYLKDKAVSTSGNYRKFFMENGIRYSHEIDPATGYSVRNSLLSVSVVAANCADADAYATAFMVMGVEKSLAFLKKHKELDAYFIYSANDGKIKTCETEGLKELLKEKE